MQGDAGHAPQLSAHLLLPDLPDAHGGVLGPGTQDEAIGVELHGRVPTAQGFLAHLHDQQSEGEECSTSKGRCYRLGTEMQEGMESANETQQAWQGCFTNTKSDLTRVKLSPGEMWIAEFSQSILS